MTAETGSTSFEVATFKDKDGWLALARGSLPDKAVILGLGVAMAVCLKFLDPATAGALLALLMSWLASSS
jgi:hypothetical protein